MLLENKIAVIHGGSGVIGGAIARAFAREGARVWITGRTGAKVRKAVEDIMAGGGVASGIVLDALDESAVEHHAEAVATEAGRIDIAVNAIGIMHVQGKSLFELSLAEFESPLHDFMRAEFTTAKAAARQMAKNHSGVILTLSTPGAKLAFSGVLGFGITCAAIEAFSRLLAADLAPSGIRVVCLRSDAIPETIALGSYARNVFEPLATRAGKTVEAMLAPDTSASLLKRYPRLVEVASAAVLAASDHGGALNGAIMNLTGGVVMD